MRLFDVAQSTEALPGQWVKHSPGIEAQIRALTPSEEKDLERRYGFRKVRSTKGGPEVDVNHDKSDAALLQRAMKALIETRGAEVQVVDAASAEIYAGLLGMPVKAGDMAKLDGKWTDALKRQALQDAPRFAIWVVKQSNKLREAEAEDEEGKDEG